MNYDMNMIKYRKSGFFRIAAAILMICFTLFGLTACAGTLQRPAGAASHGRALLGCSDELVHVLKQLLLGYSRIPLRHLHILVTEQ